ncbi:MAG: hypothetical protein M0R47_13620 [Methylobacter sp.]|jgi:hypothetical protein|uniref:hypothetical protein n=1 Tax=Methylobacter sp. TaxID=2051955 RepID=UPI0025E28655|nr:hypothetical protein [Methylobacter sp.]MCK9621560.1 hypothetical protein [Methylobacter sp.]
MKTSACQTPNHRSLFYRRLEPIREGLAWWRKIPVFCSPPLRKIRRIDCEMAPMDYAGLHLINMRARLTRTATFQIPIVHPLFWSIAA